MARNRYALFEALLLIPLLFVLLLSPSSGLADGPARSSGQGPSTAQADLRAVWELARKAGSYRFLSTVEQTLITRPIPEMIGQRDTRVTLEYDGAVILPDRAYLEMRVAQGATNAASVVILRDGAQAYMLQGGELKPVSDPISLAAPTNDFLGYLAAAENVVLLGSPEGQPQLKRYIFDLNSALFAEQVRAQTEVAMRAEPGAPQGLTVPASPSLRKLSGHGELWVSPQGLPVRQVMDLEWPEVNEAYGARIHMVVDLSGYGQVSALPRAVQGPDGKWRIEGATSVESGGRLDVATPSEVVDGRPSLAVSEPPAALRLPPSTLFLFVLCLSAIIVIRSLWGRPRRAYAVIACTIAALMVSTPTLQAGQAVRFRDRQSRIAAEQAVVGQEMLRTLGLATDSTSPQATQADGRSPLVSTTRPHTAGQTLSTDQASALARCGDPTTGADTDGDWLSDEFEICLGTSPYSTDTDGDGIPDNTELNGFYWRDRQWHSDPLKADTNGDGISDALEWSSMEAPDLGQAVIADLDWDGVPNIWDTDDDGDGVPDWLDLSPFATTTFTTTLSVSTSGAGFDGYEYIEIAVQPQNQAHLRYSTTSLDWPTDDQGNIQDLDASTEDLRMLPFLLITTNVEADAALAERYGFRSWADNTGQTILLVPLRPVQEAGAIYTFYGKVAYAPGQLDDIQWQGKMVWMAQVQADAMDGESLSTETRVLHQYEDTFGVTGLQVTKSQSYEAAVLGTPTEKDDLYLFRILLGLSDTFGSYATLEGQEAGETALQEIGQRFAVGSTATITHTFGVPTNYVAVGGPTQYGHQDAGLAGVGSNLVPNFLNDYALYYGADSCRDAAGNPVKCASLIMAYEQTQGVRDLKDLTMTDSRIASLTGLHVNLADVSLLTLRGFQLRMYEQGAGGWQLMTPSRMMEVVEQRYASSYDTGTEDTVRTQLPPW